jgi:putative endonuclease
MERGFSGEHVVYILYSLRNHKTYVGETGDLLNRFRSHNELGKKGWTLSGRPWIVVHVEFFPDRSLALKREKNLKMGQGRQWIKETILKSPYLVGLISAWGGRGSSPAPATKTERE